MLSAAFSPPVPGGLPAPATFGCAHTAYAHQSGRGFWLGQCEAATPAMALEWMRTRVWETAVQLDGPCLEVAETWLTDRRAQLSALAQLTWGQTVSFALVDDHVRYELSVRPVAAGQQLARTLPPTAQPQGDRADPAGRDQPPMTGWRYLANCLVIPLMVIAGALAALLIQQPR